MTKQIKNMKMVTQESGRTIIEIVGILAIMGILSIGGVSGYSRAMKAYRTNSVMDAVQKSATITSTTIGTGMDVITKPEAVDILKTTSGYVVHPTQSDGSSGEGKEITTAQQYFGVVVGDDTPAGGVAGAQLPTEVARNLLEKAMGDWKNVHGFGVKTGGSSGAVTYVQSLDGFDTAVGNNTTVIILLVYKSDLSLRTGPLGDGTLFVDNESPSTNDDSPFVQCRTDADCYEYFGHGTLSCESGVCVWDESPCPLGSIYVENDSACSPCNANSLALFTTKDECDKCSGFTYDRYAGFCYKGCSDPNQVYTIEDGCVDKNTIADTCGNGVMPGNECHKMPGCTTSRELGMGTYDGDSCMPTVCPTGYIHSHYECVPCSRDMDVDIGDVNGVGATECQTICQGVAYLDEGNARCTGVDF